MHCRLWLVVIVAALAGCGLFPTGSSTPDAGPTDAGPTDAGPTDAGPTDAGPTDAGPADAGPSCPAGQTSCDGQCVDLTGDDAHCGSCGNACTGAQHCAGSTCQVSKIEHVVLIVEENHTFDAYFGRYCTAPTGSDPTCTQGPSCCEAAPATEPRGASPVVLDDTSNFATDRDHTQACELQQIDGGRMDGFVSGSSGSDTCLGTGPDCSAADNFALADASTVGTYWQLAGEGALADRYFQPIAGSTSSNDMYFAIAHEQFVDNRNMPDAIGCLLDCPADAVCISANRTKYQGRTTIGDLLLTAGKTFKVYADGYAAAKAAGYGSCPGIAADCQYDAIKNPVAHQACRYDASDIPFAYYAQFADGPHIVDFSSFAIDVATGKLPNFAYVKALTTHNEHPNVSNISDGEAFVSQVVQTVEQSSLASSTLILVTWDEGGGFFDHVPPPPPIDTDAQGNPVPYGTRVPLIVLGPFVRPGTISHVQLEHSSIVRFLEYNFIGPVGQLGYNDAKVHDIGSLLDPTTTGVHVPP